VTLRGAGDKGYKRFLSDKPKECLAQDADQKMPQKKKTPLSNEKAGFSF
jgi:hypothetical protein